MSILAPEQIAQQRWGTHADLTDTLTAYAEVVRVVAEANEWCGWQGMSGLVLDEEVWLQARKLRGM